MQRFLPRLGAVFLILSIAGCASYFTRKQCEKTNWYDHGHKVAMAGKRLDADDYVKQCQKVEAEMSFTDLDRGFKAGMGKYCTGDNVYQVGKAGKKFSYEMCDGESEKKMRAKYTEGLRVFCTPSNAYRFGSSGGIYENVCPERDEDSWLTEYRKGRKIFLKAAIVEKEREVQAAAGEVSRLEMRRSTLQAQQTSLARAQTRKERRFDMRTGTYVESETAGANAEQQQRVEQMGHEIRNLEWEINKARDKQNDLSSEVSKMRTEEASL